MMDVATREHSLSRVSRAALLALAMVVAACGGDDGGSVREIEGSDSDSGSGSASEADSGSGSEADSGSASEADSGSGSEADSGSASEPSVDE